MNYIEGVLFQYDLPYEIKYNEFNIDFNKPMKKQIQNLNEDLLQIQFNNYLIDIGWYPEHNLNGKLTTYLILDNNWDNPIMKFEDLSVINFQNHFVSLLDFISNSI